MPGINDGISKGSRYYEYYEQYEYSYFSTGEVFVIHPFTVHWPPNLPNCMIFQQMYLVSATCEKFVFVSESKLLKKKKRKICI